MLRALNQRSQEVFCHIVDAYVETGAPIASKALSEGMKLSSATIRNVMADLETKGLLYAPHTSAGRMPTEAGLRFFINGLLEVGDLSTQERETLASSCCTEGRNVEKVLDEVTTTLSGLSKCAGLVLSPKSETTLKHIEFVSLSPERVLVILVTEEGLVENRVIEVPMGLPPSSLTEATNFLNAQLAGRSLSEIKKQLLGELEVHKHQLDCLSSKVIEKGLGVWSGSEEHPTLIVRGQGHLLSDIKQVEELEHLKNIFDVFEMRQELLNLLEDVTNADGVQIFIGAENELFKHSGCSVIVSPYTNDKGCVVGAIGVIGPTRLNYSRIIPMVDFTAKLIGRSLG